MVEGKCSFLKLYLLLFVLFTFLCLLSDVAKASTYYLSPFGNDSNQGTSLDQAWATFNHACSQLKAGDILYVVNGTYIDDFCVISGSGNATHPVIIKAYNGTPILRNVDRSVPQAIYSDTNSYITIDGITVDGYMYGIYFRCSAGHLCYNVTISNCTIKNTGSFGIYIRKIGETYGFYNVSIINNKLKDTGDDAIYCIGLLDSLIKNNTIINAGVSTAGYGIGYVMRNTIVENNYLTNCSSHAISFGTGTSLVVVRNNTIVDTPSRGIRFDYHSWNNVIENNFLKNVRGMSIDLYPNTSTYVLNNRILNCSYIHVGGAKYIIFENNTIYGTYMNFDGWSFSYPVNGTLLFKNNIVEGLTNSYAPMNLNDYDAIIENNIFKNIHPLGQFIDCSSEVNNSKTIIIKNNIFYDFLPYVIRIRDNTNFYSIRNNIFYKTNNYGVYIDSSDKVTIKYNAIWKNATRLVYGSSDNYTLYADPMFVDPPNDFHLKSTAGRWDPLTQSWVIDAVTSPCIDAGDPTDDYSNEPEPNGGRINIGAYGNTPEASRSPVGIITGTVTDSTGNPIGGVTITADSYSTTTNSSGGYTLTLPAGTYTVTASKSGYQSQTQTVEVSVGQTIILNFQLTLTDSTPPTIHFVSPTANYTNKNWVYVNTTIEDESPVFGLINWNNSLVAYWSFNSINNSNYTLDFVSDNHGLLGNGSEESMPALTQGKFGSALQFDGIDDFVRVADSDAFDGLKEITIEAWIKPVLGERGSIVNKYLYNYTIPINEKAFELDVQPDGRISFALSSNGTTAGTVWLTSSMSVINNSWNYVVAVSDGETMKIYINGVQDPNTKPAPPVIHSSSYDLYIGRWRYSNTEWDCPFKGIIDELRIWKRALSAEEIKAYYNSRIEGNFTNLSGGVYEYYAYAIDTAGNWNRTETRYITVNLTMPLLISCDSDGVEKDVFYTSETIYAKCINLPPDKEVDIYIVNNTDWQDGKPIGSYQNVVTAATDSEGVVFVAVWSNPEAGYYDIVVDVNRDGYYNASMDAVDDVSALPGVTAIVISTQIEINSLSFGDIAANESAYYYVTSQGVGSVAENENASGIVEFAVIQETAQIQVSIGANKTLPHNATIYLDDDTVPNESDATMIVIRGNEENIAEIVGNSTITADRLYVFVKTGNEGEFNVDVELTIS